MVDASAKVAAVKTAMDDPSISEANKSVAALNISLFAVLEALIEKVVIPQANNTNVGNAPPHPP